MSRPSPKRFLPLVVIAVGLLAYAGFSRYRASLPYEWSGTVEARTIEVGSRVGGRVKEVLVREGDRVKEGQPLVVLGPGDLDAQRLMADAQLRQAEAALAKLENGARPEEIAQAKARAAGAYAALQMSRTGARREDVDAARSRLAAAQVAVDKAGLDVDRARKLFATGAVAKAEVDNVEASQRGAVAQRDAAKSTLEELENGVRREELAQVASRADEAQAQAKLVVSGARIEDLSAARAAVDVAKGRLDQIQVAISELTIRAPRATRVESLDLRPGDLLPPNGAAATLVEDDALYVRIYVPETQLGLVKTGAKLPVFVDSFPGRAFDGTVQHVGSVGEYSPRNLQTADERAFQVFAARVELSSAPSSGQNELRAGMAALVKVAH
jgi:multidrug resistance efflux pump